MRTHNPAMPTAADITADAMAGFIAYGRRIRSTGRPMAIRGLTVWTAPAPEGGIILYGGTVRFAVLDGAGGVQITGLTPAAAASMVRALIEGGEQDGAAVIAWHCTAVIPPGEPMPRYEIVPCEGLLPDGTQLRIGADSRESRRIAAVIRRHRRGMDMNWRHTVHVASLRLTVMQLMEQGEQEAVRMKGHRQRGSRRMRRRERSWRPGSGAAK